MGDALIGLRISGDDMQCYDEEYVRHLHAIDRLTVMCKIANNKLRAIKKQLDKNYKLINNIRRIYELHIRMAGESKMYGL